eukprot:TRINITY_DN27947_c0_g1_i2.p1 TRINITY_DN27947_c0_g1~~TRINITY_DN27947_c0_g1_i2.p1  ORF type:complete len:274 (+),score=45.81 TRINITY_DN27947_c0_g1_i2:25-822(+)
MEPRGGQRLHLPSPPSRPDTANSQARPQPHRFLQDSALKLADDAGRFLAGTPDGKRQTTPSTAATYRPSTGDTVSSLQSARSAGWNETSHEKLMSSAFLTEAGECIRSLQAVFDTANMSTFASRFEDWRKVDLRATAQMQMHVKTLNQLNESVDEFLTRSATPDEFKNFYGTMVTLSRSVDELGLFHSELKTTTDRIAQRACASVLSSWKSEWGSISSKLQTHLDSQHEKQENIVSRQTDIYGRLDRLEASTSRLCSEMAEQRES